MTSVCLYCYLLRVFGRNHFAGDFLPGRSIALNKPEISFDCMQKGVCQRGLRKAMFIRQNTIVSDIS